MDVGELTDDELRERLTKNGADPVCVRDLIAHRRDTEDAEAELQRLEDFTGRPAAWPPKLETKAG